jgi:hypothetical protein
VEGSREERERWQKDRVKGRNREKERGKGREWCSGCKEGGERFVTENSEVVLIVFGKAIEETVRVHIYKSWN